MTRPFERGDVLKRRYTIDHELGRGGIGIVYLAYDQRLHDMPVVIKFLLEESTENDWLINKFKQEAEALSRINHPGVVHVMDCDITDDGRSFFVMEFIDGKPLQSVMNPDGLGFEFAAQILKQIGSALHAAHQCNVFHRDLKPGNVLLQNLSAGRMQAKLIDFGISKVTDSKAATSTKSYVLAGSLQYMAPEQISGGSISASTDIYALGIIAYEMVTGRRPFKPDAQNQVAMIQQILDMQEAEDVVEPKRLRPGLPEAAEALILSALSYEVADRPQNAQTFADDLAAALVGETADPPSQRTSKAFKPTTSYRSTRPRSVPEIQKEPGTPGWKYIFLQTISDVAGATAIIPATMILNSVVAGQRDPSGFFTPLLVLLVLLIAGASLKKILKSLYSFSNAPGLKLILLWAIRFAVLFLFIIQYAGDLLRVGVMNISVTSCVVILIITSFFETLLNERKALLKKDYGGKDSYNARWIEGRAISLVIGLIVALILSIDMLGRIHSHFSGHSTQTQTTTTRLQFRRGTTSTNVSGQIYPGTRSQYVLEARSGQSLSATVNSGNNCVVFDNGGTSRSYRTHSGDNYVYLQNNCGSAMSFTMTVSIN